MSDILERIVEVKHEELRALRRRYTENDLIEIAGSQSPVRGFASRLDAVAESGAAVIAEIKKASPSKGVIREAFEPAEIARQYVQGGAACLSVLTDERFFQGASAYLEQARAACELPVLRKDFTVANLQVIEARALAADCILLIAAILSRSQLEDLAACAADFGLDVLVEVHDADELAMVAQCQLPGRHLLGINNRNLRTFETRLETTLELMREAPDGAEIVTESGIHTAAQIQDMRTAGVQRFLIGESLMRAPDPGAALRALISPD